MITYSREDEILKITDYGFNKLLNKEDPSRSAIDDLTPELRNIITQGVAPKNIISGELAAALDQVLANLHSGKETFSVNETGYILGVDPADGLAKFYLGNSTNYVYFDGSTLQITGGTVVGSVAGFVLTATEMTGGNLVIGSASQRIAWGSGSDILIADADDATYRLWAGNSTAASAPFSVTKAGVVNIDSGTIDGVTIGGSSAAAGTFSTLTATSIVIGANTITTSEWANLDGLNQTLATTSSPTFVNLTITSFAANWTNAGRTVADLGIVTTVDINGGTLDGVAIGSASPSSGIFTSLQADSITNDTGLAAGTYSPTRSSETNLDSSVTMTEAQYLRVGNTVTVSGRFTADPTTTLVATNFEIDLPVASNLGAAEDLAGTAVCGTTSECAEIIGVAANNTAQIQWLPTDVTSQTWSYTFTYQVI